MNFKDILLEAAASIQKRAPGFHAKMGLILGSGLGPLADELENAIVIPYEEIPHFPVSAVAGHAGNLILGKLSGVPVACLKGRVHMYEGTPLEKIKILIRMLRHLGAHTLFMTNAAGSLRRHIRAGEIVLITDHINFAQYSPLIGPNDDEFGPRFFPMDNAYDLDLRNKMKAAARKANIDLHEGVLLSTLGPSFETPAEIYAFRTLGADLAGMSVIPETLIARHCGLKVVAISAVTNLAAGMLDESLSHEGTLHYAKFSSEKLCALTKTFLELNADEFNHL
jgi:xanthosine phosphorylase